MYEVRVRKCFWAVHGLRLPDGSVEPLHGHNWQVEAVFRGSSLDDCGLLVDFTAVQQALAEVLEPLAGRNLGEVPELGGGNPTAELLARHVYERLHGRLGSQAALTAVHVEEAEGCVAAYSA